MQRFPFVSSLLIMIFSSCSLCDTTNCIGDNYYGQFRIVDKVSGADLVFGSTAKYEKTQIRFYSINGTDTVNYEYSTIKLPGAGYDSILYVTFYPRVNVPVYIKLSPADTDTLMITYASSKSKCCGSSTEITKYVYNNFTEIQGNMGTQEIKK